MNSATVRNVLAAAAALCADLTFDTDDRIAPLARTLADLTAADFLARASEAGIFPSLVAASAAADHASDFLPQEGLAFIPSPGDDGGWRVRVRDRDGDPIGWL
jgi:hypothetical protein